MVFAVLYCCISCAEIQDRLLCFGIQLFKVSKTAIFSRARTLYILQVCVLV